MGCLGNMCRELFGREGVGIGIVISTKLFGFNAMDEIMSRHSVEIPMNNPPITTLCCPSRQAGNITI